MSQIETFLDENGHPMEFRILGKFSADDMDYIAVEPVVGLEPLVHILRIDLDQDGQEYLVGINDGKLAIAQEVYGELINQKEQAMGRAEEFVRELLKNKGYRFTSQRVEIYRVFLENKGKHLSCENVYETVSKKDSEIGIAIVHRTMQLFGELGVLYSINFDDQTTRYELRDETDRHYHHHVICLSCGKAIEMEHNFLDTLEDTIERKENFKIVDHSLKFYGYCVDYQKRGVKNEKQ